MKYIIELDSSERDVSLYPLPSDYTLSLDRTIYNVEKIRVVSAVIPRSQLLINSENKQFSIDSTTITLDEKNYLTGTALASDLATKLAATPITSVTFDSTTNRLTFSGSTDFTLSFGTTGPMSVLGFSSNTVTSTSSTLVSGAIDLIGPTSIIMKLSSGSDDDIDGGLYTSTHNGVYFGRFMSTDLAIIKQSFTTDPLEHDFVSSNKRDIKNLRLSLYWKNCGRLVPYDFMDRNHIIKLEITGNTDKLNSTTIDDEYKKPELPPVVDFPMMGRKIRDISPDKIIPIVLAIVLLLGLVSLANRTVKENSTG